MTTDAVIKTAIWLIVALAAVGCTIGRLHVDVIDMNNVETSAFEEVLPKPAAQVDFEWDF